MARIAINRLNEMGEKRRKRSEKARARQEAKKNQSAE